MKSDKTANWIALIWLPVAFGLTLPAYLWHQEFFHSTGPYYLGVRALPVLCAAALGYAAWLRAGVRRYELACLVLFPAVVCSAAQPFACLAVIAIALAALVSGDCATRLMGFESRDTPVVWTCGFGILILIGAALGKVGILSLPVVLVLIALCLCRMVFVRRRLFRWLAVPFATWSAGAELASPVTGICIFFLVLFTGCSLLVALTPTNAFDVVLYHFPLARYYAQTHSIQPTPWILESYYPQGAEVLMAVAFLLAGEPAARLLLPLMAVLFLWMLVRVARCCGFNRSAAVMGASIAATFPFLQWTLTVPKNDSAFSLFQIGALYSFLQWQSGRGARWLLLLAFLLGQTAGIKHVALFGLVAMAALCIDGLFRRKFTWRLAGAMVLIFIVTGLFWQVQTWALMGNPTYPARAASVAHAPGQEQGGRLIHAAVRYATLPWYLLFHGQKAFESASPNPLGMFCFLFLPVAAAVIWMSCWSPARKACFCFTAVYLLFWCSIISTLRYAIVPFALLGLGLGGAVARFVESRNWIKRSAVLAFTSYGFLFSLLVVMSIEVNSLQPAFLLNRITQADYLRRTIPAIQPLTRLATLFPDASAFGVDTCARYYAPNSLRFACVLCADGCLLKDIMKTLGDGQFEFAILPANAAFRQYREAVLTKFGAKVVDNDGQFVILRLPR